ncbi:MAG: polysaccharide biosynthesis/export family protein, partial [Alphaproteobacteria bacterium]|nr:polysaccharide biosynthesis/export family protein [Alphaproteobacteria bacterium]
MTFASRFTTLSCAVLLLLSTAACNQTSHPREPQASLAASAATAPSKAYTLGPGDRLRIKVFNEQELSGEFDVDSVGKINMPLVGEIPVAKLT